MSKKIIYNSQHNLYPSFRLKKLVHPQMPIMLDEDLDKINSVVMTSSNNTQFSSLNVPINLDSHNLVKAADRQFVNFNTMSLHTYEQHVGIDKIYNARFTSAHYKAVGESVLKLSETDAKTDILYLDNIFMYDQKLVNLNQKKDFLNSYLNDGIKHGVFSKNSRYMVINNVYYVSDTKFISDMVDNKKFSGFINEIDQNSTLPFILDSQLKFNLITEKAHYNLRTEYEVKLKSNNFVEVFNDLTDVKVSNNPTDPTDLGF